MRPEGKQECATNVLMPKKELEAEIKRLQEYRLVLRRALERALPVLKDAVLAKDALGPEHIAFQGLGRLQDRVEQARLALRQPNA